MVLWNLTPLVAISAIRSTVDIPNGWFTVCSPQWGGHQLQICNVYSPMPATQVHPHSNTDNSAKCALSPCISHHGRSYWATSTSTSLHTLTSIQEAVPTLDANSRDMARQAEAVAAQDVVLKGMQAAAAALKCSWGGGSGSVTEDTPPTPITALIQETSNCGAGPGPSRLRDPSTGQLDSNLAWIPQIIANYWRDVSAMPSAAELPTAVKQQVRVQVLEALHAYPKHMPEAEDVDSDGGRALLTSAEVTAGSTRRPHATVVTTQPRPLLLDMPSVKLTIDSASLSLEAVVPPSNKSLKYPLQLPGDTPPEWTS
ncbi:hypothetical protein VOLCADRAFT_99911 [Volvox carteri f. nagariensis]|uniref:Uncharacterized protein n=1 Tax=Volvox carteri f. nagariensis TaxID=3068 RepID=D8UIY6_VOLCA|nr:uncharacterized protein VOLCADRAFT_99911 [Volvox carteri f. nagariensis]EFJ40299.1 hypothetical protein VOLCADRAFT_99911 [Volvox carteri f. nagariensis]|eukprot:XP_002958633.1 hypothetical protein VOLCADRAFT_99911 [Volvox carteri f. nagariensis]